jgi:hypothetical protein
MTFIAKPSLSFQKINFLILHLISFNETRVRERKWTKKKTTSIPFLQHNVNEWFLAEMIFLFENIVTQSLREKEKWKP